MGKVLLLVFTITVAFIAEVTFGASLSVVNNVIATSKTNGFTYLGSISATKNGKDRSISSTVSTEVTSYYFLSQNAAGFATAERDCQAYLGEDATLLYIETHEELNNVTRFFASSDDTGTSYWIGGKYNPSKSKFVWNNEIELGPWAPWASGHPNTKLPITRVSLSTVGGLKFHTQFQTVSNRYVCELKTGHIGEEPVPCYRDNDLIIVVDSSGTISRSEYQVALEFTARLAIAWADNPRNRLCVIVYSNYVQSIFELNQNLSATQIRNHVYGAPYIGSDTASDLALTQVLNEFQQNGRQVPKNLVFLTDGVSNSRLATVAAAQRIHVAGINAFSVGIGSWVGAEELLAIAGDDSQRVFNTDGFDNLLRLLQPVSRRVCEI